MCSPGCSVPIEALAGVETVSYQFLIRGSRQRRDIKEPIFTFNFCFIAFIFFIGDATVICTSVGSSVFTVSLISLSEKQKHVSDVFCPYSKVRPLEYWTFRLEHILS